MSEVVPMGFKSDENQIVKKRYSDFNFDQDELLKLGNPNAGAYQWESYNNFTILSFCRPVYHIHGTKFDSIF